MLKYLLIYIVSIFIFGIMYWLFWIFHPDAFMFNEQFNLNPFSSKEIAGKTDVNIKYYQTKVDSLRSLINLKRDSLDKLTLLSDSLTPIADKVYKEFEEARWKNVHDWEIKQYPDTLLANLTAIKQIIKSYEEKNTDPYGLVLSQLNLYIVKLKYDSLLIAIKTNDFILNNLSYFSDPILLDDYESIDSLLYKYQTTIPKTKTDILKIENQIEELKYESLRNLSKRISFLDFILFSASNSSTVTYGEIVPNHNAMRLTLFFQALFCIIIIALGTNKIIKKD